MYILPFLSPHSEISGKHIFLIFYYGTDTCNVCYIIIYDYGSLLFCVMRLESIFRERLSAIKVLLLLELVLRPNQL